MRKYGLLLSGLLALTFSCNTPNQSVEESQMCDTIFRTEIYHPGDYDSKNYRIPAIITAKDGSLVIATDRRKNNEGDLPEDIDIVINRSTDSGRSWGEPVVLAQGTGYEHGFGDCALAQTNDEGGLMAAFVGGCGLWSSTPEQPIHSYIARSFDNGQTWTEPKDVTALIFGDECADSVRRTWRASFFGSGNGLLTSTGRIMFVAAIRETEEWKLFNYVFYSDDNGESWNVSQRASVGGDEAKVVEINDGRILMSIRHDGNRWYNISNDGGVTWQPEVSVWDDIVAPACDGDIIRYDFGGEHCLLHSVPFGDNRDSVTVLVSHDEGTTWPVRRCVVPYPSAYSSLCVLPDGTIGLYVEERQDDSLGYSMVFYNFGMNWLTKK